MEVCMGDITTETGYAKREDRMAVLLFCASGLRLEAGARWRMAPYAGIFALRSPAPRLANLLRICYTNPKRVTREAPMSGILYLVATPIGNLGDLSPRAAETLANADFIAAEDTRVTMKLLSHLNLKKPLVSYHEHNRACAGPAILARLQSGETCALVTDAGTPAISDPGEDLVRLCAENDVPVQSIPGCCALISALAVSALPTRRFVFEGFLPVNKAERRERLQKLLPEERTIILYEAPHRLRATLADLRAAFGDRDIALCRELTKLHEDTMRATLAQAAEWYESHEPRGEYVLVLAGREASPEAAVTLEEAVVMVLERRAKGERMKDAVRQVSADTGLPRNELYDAALRAARAE